MSETSKPNVILITTDMQRHDTLGCNGASMVRTPAVDALAGDGTRFDRPYINSPVCIPSRACIQTGRYIHQHGVRYMENEIEKTPGLPPWEQTFMERLQVAGYDTGAVGKIHMKPPKGFRWTRLTNGKGGRWTVPYGSPYGPAQLGDEYAHWLEQRHPGGYEAIYEQRRRPENKQRLGYVNVLPTEEYVDYWVTENALDFTSQSRDQPFFLWYGFCAPHGPKAPPAEYADLYPLDQIPLSSRFTEYDGEMPEVLTEQNLRRYIAYYWSLCTLIDDMVAKLVAQLKEAGLYDNTLIIFTSDHGEMLGAFGSLSIGRFDEAVTRVPLIVKPPRGDVGPTPESDGMVESIDIAPTILDYAGLPVPERIEGTSLRPIVENTGSGGKEQVLCEHTTNDRSLSGKSVRTDRYKYAYWGPDRGAELYDMQEDPGEWRNLADEPAYQKLRIEMHDRLMEHLLMSQRPVFSGQ